MSTLSGEDVGQCREEADKRVEEPWPGVVSFDSIPRTWTICSYRKMRETSQM